MVGIKKREQSLNPFTIMNENKIATEEKRVREQSSTETNLQIDEDILKNIKYYSDLSEEVINKRIKKLEREWDIERLLEINLSTLALTGILLSIIKHRSWIILSTVALGFFAQHAIQGWCPPLPVLRFFKKRTRNEINNEKHALKALRGDYEDIKTAEEAFQAVKKQAK